MMGSPRRADGWPLAVPVGPLGGARPWEDTLGVEWGLAREPGKAALRKGVLPHRGVFMLPSVMGVAMGVWGTSAHPALK